MEDAVDILEKIITEFPQKKKEISLIYARSSDFIEICEDYVFCQESIKNLKAKKKPSNEKELAELKELIKELEEELLSRI